MANMVKQATAVESTSETPEKSPGISERVISREGSNWVTKGKTEAETDSLYLILKAADPSIHICRFVDGIKQVEDPNGSIEQTAERMTRNEMINYLFRNGASKGLSLDTPDETLRGAVRTHMMKARTVRKISK